MVLHVRTTEAKTVPPPFITTSTTPDAHLARLAKVIAKAKRVVVVCGAGVSVQAGIPDFRSSEGLFQTLKKENPKEGLSSGRDLFESSVYNSEATATLFYKMIAGLSQAVQDAKPTPFHELLNTLDKRGQLIRCYTQNIDSLEEKVGLSYGVPPPPQRKSPKKRPPQAGSQSPSGSPAAPIPSADTTPRCIPLHGTLKNLHCRACSATFPLADSIHLFVDGTIPLCPQCSEFETTRQIVGKRSRGVGILRPSIVLYGEEHQEGEGVGDIVKRDLTGGKNRRAPPDLLLVVGTSLRGVPGTKRIVKEFSKAARSGLPSASPPSSQPSTPSASRKASPSEAPDDQPHPMRTVYLNLDFPMPARDWESTFDVWVQGDLQDVAARVQKEIASDEEAKRLKEERKQLTGERRKRSVEDEGDWFGSRTSPSKRSRRNNYTFSGSRVKKEQDTKPETVKQERGDSEWTSHLPDSYPSSPLHRTGPIHVSVTCPGARIGRPPTRPLLPVLLSQSLPPSPLKTGSIHHSHILSALEAPPAIPTSAQRKMSLAHITNPLDDQRPALDRGFGHAVRSRRLSINEIAPPMEVDAPA